MLTKKHEDVFFDVRLNRDPSCTLDLLIVYTQGKSPDEDRGGIRKTFSPWAEVAAQMLMQGSEAAPELPAAQVEILRSDSAMQAWYATKVE